MDLHEKLAFSTSPYSVHSTVNDICKRALGVVCDCFTEYVIAVATSPELSTSAGERVNFPAVIEPLFHPRMPLLDRRERFEVLRLKLFDDLLFDLGLVRQCTWPSPVITTVTDLFRHEPSRVMTIV